MKHHLIVDGERTEKFFSHNQRLHVYGSGQGAGWSPFLWTSVDDVILKTMMQHHPGMSFLSPDGKTSVTHTILAFLDDTSGGVNSLGAWQHEQREDLDLLEVSQKVMQAYETYLHLTGGQVDLKKTFIYHLIPDSSAPLFKFKKSTTFRPSLTRTEDGKCFPIPQKPTDEAHSFLGAYWSPGGDRRTQIEVLLDKVRQWIEKIGRGNFLPWQKLLSLNTQLLPDLYYVLPCL